MDRRSGFAQPNDTDGPLSPKRDAIQESDMNGIVALLQLSAGKKNNRKRRDVMNSPSQFGSPDKRGRGYSPVGAPLSPPSRVIQMLPMSAMSPRQVGLHRVHGLPGSGVSSSIPGMVHLHEVPSWMKEAQKRMDRATAPLPVTSTTATSLASGQPRQSELWVVSKRTLQRGGRREAKRHAQYRETLRSISQLSRPAGPVEGPVEAPVSVAGKTAEVGYGAHGHVDGEGGLDVKVDGSRAGIISGDEASGAKIASKVTPPDPVGATVRVGRPLMDLRRDDRHGTLSAFIGREFFYSNAEEAYFGEGREWMNGVLQDVGLDATGDVMLTKAEWAALRSSMKGRGAIRRLSTKFMHDSRAELRMHREREGAKHTFSVGQAVTAVHPETFEVQDGVVLTLAGADKCRVQFDRVDLGVHLVPMIMLRKANQPGLGSLAAPGGTVAAVPATMPGAQGTPNISTSQGMHGLQHIPNVQPHSTESRSIAMQQQMAPVAIPLSYMLTAYMQNSGMRTPDTSPEKLPSYGLPQHHHVPVHSPSQILGDAQHVKIEEDTKVAAEFRFNEEAIKEMSVPEKRRYVLSEMNRALRAACSPENKNRIDREVSFMYADCVDEIDNIKEGQGMLGGAIHPVLNFGLDIEFQAGWRGHQRIRNELKEHIKQLLTMLMMLERTPSMFDVFLRGLELLV